MERHPHRSTAGRNIADESDVVELDLTDEHALLAANDVATDPTGSRARLAALNLRAPGASIDPADGVLDMAIYRATGDRRLAALFGRAA